MKKLQARSSIKNGYKDVDVKLIGDVPWAMMNSDNEIGRAMQRTYQIMGIPHSPVRADWGIGGGGAAAGGYWPAYMFGNGEVGEKISPFKGVPIVMGGAGLGGRAHAANEYYVIEGAGKVYGMAGAEKARRASRCTPSPARFRRPPPSRRPRTRGQGLGAQGLGAGARAQARGPATSDDWRFAIWRRITTWATTWCAPCGASRSTSRRASS